MAQLGRADALCWFGATGDLGFRMTFPSLYAMARRGALDVPIVAVARSGWNLDQLKERGRASIEQFTSSDVAANQGLENVDAAALDHLMQSLRYVDGDYTDPFTFAALRHELDAVGSRAPCHYLAIPPSMFPMVIASLGSSGCADNARVVVEKPFGRDLTSARQLDDVMHTVFPEDRVFRIDHYLGKEEVQNLSYVRFANSVFEPLWGRDHIACIQITMAEDFGVEGRGAFYDEAGALRDVVQNHLFQIVSLLAMSPPAGHDVDAFREEKERVLRAVDPLTRDDVVRGQFVGYHDEAGVAPSSETETFAAVRLHIDSWRWAGVPWYLRAGKQLPCHTTEVLVEFSQPPQRVFRSEAVDLAAEPNFIRFRLSPDPHIALGVRTLIASDGIRGRRNELLLSDNVHDERLPYERLLGDAIAGDQFLFTSERGMEAAWEIVDRVLTSRASAIPYRPHTWGPVEANRLIEDGLGWRPPSVAAVTDG
jgi:glucose-6-phosphate 1-dehydrogenase